MTECSEVSGSEGSEGSECASIELVPQSDDGNSDLQRASATSPTS